ncbi:MAG TPA: hypothetical protein VJG30_00395 [Candidatus Nanoarchaeia archaeon]|nr:hypothetical protein [Candidatus Nanoarchaeia archaeon]
MVENQLTENGIELRVDESSYEEIFPKKKLVNIGIRFLALGTDPKEMAKYIERLPLDIQEEAALNYIEVRKSMGKSYSYSD